MHTQKKKTSAHTIRRRYPRKQMNSKYPSWIPNELDPFSKSNLLLVFFSFIWNSCLCIWTEKLNRALIWMKVELWTELRMGIIKMMMMMVLRWWSLHKDSKLCYSLDCHILRKNINKLYTLYWSILHILFCTHICSF